MVEESIEQSTTLRSSWGVTAGTAAPLAISGPRDPFQPRGRHGRHGWRYRENRGGYWRQSVAGEEGLVAGPDPPPGGALGAVGPSEIEGSLAKGDEGWRPPDTARGESSGGGRGSQGIGEIGRAHV